MKRSLLLALLLCAAAPGAGHGQDWRPPGREMPSMPRLSELEGDWLAPREAWFRDVEALSGVAPAGLQAGGEPRSGAEYLQIARFSSRMVPVMVWSDRNGDTRADMIEIYRKGGLIIQLVDADFDGNANVIRYYDASRKLLREERVGR